MFVKGIINNIVCKGIINEYCDGYKRQKWYRIGGSDCLLKTQDFAKS